MSELIAPRGHENAAGAGVSWPGRLDVVVLESKLVPRLLGFPPAPARGCSPSSPAA